jgi:hypothetical protein
MRFHACPDDKVILGLAGLSLDGPMARVIDGAIRQ